MKKTGIAPYEGADLYVFRYRQIADGTWALGNSKPCMHCTALIKTAKIKNVYYSYSNYLGNNQYECGIMKERVRDLETDHISFGRLRELGFPGKSKTNKKINEKINEKTYEKINKKKKSPIRR